MYNTNHEAFQNADPWPASHPVRMPQVAYETQWNTTMFNSMWPAGGASPFYLSYNDNLGYGTHADYVFGWKGDALQRAMDSSCMFTGWENGQPLLSQGAADQNKRTIKSTVTENIDGWISELPMSPM